MCYAIPAKIIRIAGDTASVDYGGVTKQVNISLVDDPRPEDYVLIHAGFAIEKLDQRTAKESLAIIRSQLEATDNAQSAAGEVREVRVGSRSHGESAKEGASGKNAVGKDCEGGGSADG